MSTEIDIKPLLKERYAGGNSKSSSKSFKRLKEYVKPKSPKPGDKARGNKY